MVIFSSLLLLFGFFNFHTGRRNWHPKSIICGVSHFTNIPNYFKSSIRFPYILNLLITDIWSEVQQDSFKRRMVFNLLKEMVTQSFNVISFQELQHWAPFQELEQLIRHIYQSTNLESMERSKSLRLFAFSLLSKNKIIHTFITNNFAACEDYCFQFCAHAQFLH